MGDKKDMPTSATAISSHKHRPFTLYAVKNMVLKPQIRPNVKILSYA
jgi:hypothetical protein